jgi:Abortive infection alpha
LSGSLEEDDAVQEMWARLMANAIDPDKRTKPEKVYVDLLKSISGREAILLDLVDQIEDKGHRFKNNAEIMSRPPEAEWPAQPYSLHKRSKTFAV